MGFSCIWVPRNGMARVGACAVPDALKQLFLDELPLIWFAENS